MMAASPGRGGTSSGGEFISESQVFGQINRKITSKIFSGGYCSVVFGDIRLDLTEAELSAGDRPLRFSSVFGDVRVELPPSVEYCIKVNYVAGKVDVKGGRRTGLFQNVSIQSRGFTSAERRLTVHVSSVFGNLRVS